MFVVSIFAVNKLSTKLPNNFLAIQNSNIMCKPMTTERKAQIQEKQLKIFTAIAKYRDNHLNHERNHRAQILFIRLLETSQNEELRMRLNL